MVAVYLAPDWREEAGSSVTVFLEYVTVAETGLVSPSLTSVTVVAFKEFEAMTSEKVAVTLVVGEIPVAPFAGLTV
jgi:hypothetical protein